MAKTVIIPGRLHNPEQGNVVTGANEILDDTKGKKQNVINSEVDAELVRLDNSKQDNLTFDSTPTENSTNPVTSGGVYAAELTLSQAIEAILLLIPSAASALNKLVDTETMNSSIATATATFKGTYNLVTDLSLGVDATHEQIAAKLLEVITTADNNDYAFVQVPTNAGTPTEIRVTERYKFNGTAWAYEYDLNNSGFTAAQWAAINSGITALLVSKLSDLPTATELATALAGKQAVLTFDNAPTQDSDNPVKSGGIYTAIKNETDARELSEQGLQQGISTNAGDISDIKDVLPSGATAANKLVDNDSMVAYVTTLISGISATFNVTSADGHITLHITQVDGEITSVTLTTSDIASAAALNLKASKADLEALTSVVNTKAAQADLTTLAGRVSVNETDISNLQAAYAGLTQSDIIVGALPASGVANKIYRVPGTTSYSDYMWNGSTFVLMATYNNAIDDVPTYNSDNLVKSGGVLDALTKDKNFFYKVVGIGAEHKSSNNFSGLASNTVVFTSSRSQSYVSGYLKKIEIDTESNGVVRIAIGTINQDTSITIRDEFDVTFKGSATRKACDISLMRKFINKGEYVFVYNKAYNDSPRIGVVISGSPQAVLDPCLISSNADRTASGKETNRLVPLYYEVYECEESADMEIETERLIGKDVEFSEYPSANIVGVDNYALNYYILDGPSSGLKYCYFNTYDVDYLKITAHSSLPTLVTFCNNPAKGLWEIAKDTTPLYIPAGETRVIKLGGKVNTVAVSHSYVNLFGYPSYIGYTKYEYDGYVNNNLMKLLKNSGTLDIENLNVTSTSCVFTSDNVKPGEKIHYDFDLPEPLTNYAAAYMIVKGENSNLMLIGDNGQGAGTTHFEGDFYLPENYKNVVFWSTKKGLEFTINKLCIADKRVDDLTFGTPEIVMTNDSGHDDYDKYMAYFKVLKVSETMYYMYYSCWGDNDSERDDYQHLAFAYSTDGVSWTRGFPEGVEAPIPGTNLLFESGVIGMDVFRVNDPQYPYRMVSTKMNGLVGGALEMWKSNDAIHFEKISVLSPWMHDNQVSCIVRGDIVKVYTRMISNSAGNQSSGGDTRWVGVLTCDIYGNVICPASLFCGYKWYHAAASLLDQDRDIAFPSYYEPSNDSMRIDCYIIEGNSVKQVDVDTSVLYGSDEGQFHVQPGLVCIGGEMYMYYCGMNKTHNVPYTGKIQRYKRVKVNYKTIGHTVF